MTRVVPGSGGVITLFGVMFEGGRMTPSVLSRHSLKVSPDRQVDPVERGSCGPVLSD